MNLEKYYPDIIKSISDLVRISTVYDAASVTPAMPYGKNVHAGYEWLKKRALADGFEVLEFDGHALAIRIPGNNTGERIDVVSHLDVVAPGDGWLDDPFSGAVSDGAIHGRGTQDMKAALMLTYYGLKYIKDQRIPLKREIRVVAGCDEERTMEDIRYYAKKAGDPVFAFTPDGKFPYTLGEKGALMWCVDGIVDTSIEVLDGGVQCNVVSPEASALIRYGGSPDEYEKVLKQKGYPGGVSREGDCIRLQVFGKAAHASRPQDGENATVRLLGLISCVNSDPLAELLYRCFSDYNGRGASLDYDIEPMGKLTMNLGILRIRDNKVLAEVDCRYPYGITSDILTDKLQRALSPLKVTLQYDDRPTLADKNSPWLRILLDTYREISGDINAEPVISGGVTYGKAMKNCVAFGPGREGDQVLAHQANERIEIEKVKQLYRIYTTAMIRLAAS